MRHPEITDWADFVRAGADDGDRAALQEHLDAGCGLCRATVVALERVAQLAAAELSAAVPGGAVRSVKAYFATRHPESHGRWRELRLGRTFDSHLAPAPAASRADGTPARQLLFESEEYTVELSLDRAPGDSDAVLRGQILAAHGGPRSHAPVFLVGAGEVIARTVSEPQGTFEMSGRIDHSSELWVFPDDEHRIRLSLTPQD